MKPITEYCYFQDNDLCILNYLLMDIEKKFDEILEKFNIFNNK